MAQDNKIKVRLNKTLEPFGGLVDPNAKKNPKLICKANYGKKGFMEVYETDFVHSRLESGELIKVEAVAQETDQTTNGSKDEPVQTGTTEVVTTAEGTKDETQKTGAKRGGRNK